MALFTDGPISTAADLQQYENSILTVASTENIDLAGKITLAQQDVANEIVLFLLRRPFRYEQSLWCDSSGVNSRQLTDVVITDSLRKWHVHRALALVYRDAYNNQLNNRYQAKWTEYESLAKVSARIYFQIGVGLVADPIPQAVAPMLSTVEGTAAGGTFYVAVTWVNGTGQEGMPSPFAELGTSDGQQLFVTVANPPQNAITWNVYVGNSPTTLSLQNVVPLAPSISWTMTSALNTGAQLPTGQQPTWFSVDHRVIERG
ncbi:MAG: hypothetical protein JOZ32_07375 [Bryobacterales bacterium]|nr:hypothetical protein [Bryobacterales bacterium]